MLKKIKQKLLTTLFVEWVNETEDAEALYMTKKMVSDRIDIITNHNRTIGFRIPSKIE